MKRKYSGLKAEKVSFRVNDDIVTTSPSSNCVEIVANTVLAGTNVCSNPTESTAHMYIGDNPYGD